MNLHNDILESIGNTPMVKVKNIDTGKCDLLLKLENLKRPMKEASAGKYQTTT